MVYLFIYSNIVDTVVHIVSMNAILGINFTIFHETGYKRRRKLYLEKLHLRSKSMFQLPNYELRKIFRMNKSTFAGTACVKSSFERL